MSILGQLDTAVQPDEPIDTTRPPYGSGIPPATWEAICRDVIRLSPEMSFFWPLWTRLSKKHLRRYCGRSGADPYSGTVFYALFNLYCESGGQGTPWEPWPEDRQQAAKARRRVQ